MKKITENTVTFSAPSQIARSCKPAAVEADKDGRIPYLIASKNPNEVFSVAVLGRTFGRKYEIPCCRVTVFSEKANTIGAFGEYSELVIKTRKVRRVLIQDIADNSAFDITEDVDISDGEIIIPGELIHKIGTSAQPSDDISEPGVIIKIS